MSASSSSHTRKYFLEKEIIHSLISLALKSCDASAEARAEDIKTYSINAVKTLYNLAEFDRARFYIPGETEDISQKHIKFSTWGGMLALYYLRQFCEIPEISKLLGSADIQIDDLQLILESLKKIESGDQITRIELPK